MRDQTSIFDNGARSISGDALFRAVVAFRDAAVADGWRLEPVFAHEAATRYGALHRDGFLLYVNARGLNEYGVHEARVTGWCPEGIALSMERLTSDVYDGPAIVALARACPLCGRVGVETERVAFANRACAACAPALRAKLEVGNWTE